MCNWCWCDVLTYFDIDLSRKLPADSEVYTIPADSQPTLKRDSGCHNYFWFRWFRWFSFYQLEVIQVKSDSGDSAKPLPAGNLVIQVIQQNFTSWKWFRFRSDSGDSGDSAHKWFRWFRWFSISDSGDSGDSAHKWFRWFRWFSLSDSGDSA